MNREIWTVPARGGAAAQLTNDAAGVVSDSPIFTPDGRGVVHRSNRGGASNLWWQPLDAKPPVQLTTGPGPDSSPSVARDGTIAFLNSRSRYSLLIHSLADCASTTLRTDSSRLWAPAFSPDGKDVAYSRDEPYGSWHLWITPPSGGAAPGVTFVKAPEASARFPPSCVSPSFTSL